MRYYYRIFDNGFYLPVRKWVVENEFFKPIDIDSVRKLVNETKDDLDKFFDLFEQEQKKLKENSESKSQLDTKEEKQADKPVSQTPAEVDVRKELADMRSDIEEIKGLLRDHLNAKKQTLNG